MLAEAAEAHGVELRFSCVIENFDLEKPSVTVNGEELFADFIVGADGW